MLTIPSPHWHPCSDALDELVERVRNAVALPVRIELRDAYDAACTELTVRRPVARGRCALRLLDGWCALRDACGRAEGRPPTNVWGWLLSV